MQIVSIRQSGRKVSASGMTGGSVDQLYFALRVAAVEDFLSHSTALPFIADDLFINFDEKRAAAGFKVLGELAQKTQVLFFTHHQHLIDVADATLGTNVSTIYLPEPVALAPDPLVHQDAEAPLVERVANG